MPEPAFDLILPDKRATSVIFASPHSGKTYDAEFLARIALDPVSIRSSEDAFVDRLFSAAPRFGAPLLVARAPRAYVDLNRGRDELDPTLIEGFAGGPFNPRISSGLGVIPRVVANGRPIYRGRIPRTEAEARLRQVWDPYHACLAELMADHVGRFGEAVLIDCHSMPHEAIEAVPRIGGRRPDVVLGDRFGASAGKRIVEHVEAALAAAGLHVARNAPFAGAYVAERYGRPGQGLHVVQLEIDRALYMDERQVKPAPGFADFRRLMTGVVADIAQAGRPSCAPLAAE
jgi:N-formylglutamate amidohydrolase